MQYRVKTGMAAWLLHRITGLGLVFYLILHINVTASLHDPVYFNKVMGFLGSPLFRFLEIGLLACVIYHAMNGIRVIWVDFFGGSAYHQKIFWILAVVGVVIFIFGAIPMIQHGIHGLPEGFLHVR
jgi:succinate dehydrogenase / fumarate reductase cytochrome b subunit